ncbi:MAG: hypothetical protein GQ574_13400 [Crocinitomix sp.]|nr:hypothetical protein [Crocinitomix sp.]
MKNIKTIIIILVLGGLAFTAWKLSDKGISSNLADEGLSDFAIKDTASIDKLVLTDTDGNPGVTVVRTAGGWTTAEGECVQQHLVQTLLETIKYIKVKGPVSKGAIETINKSLAAHNKKMEIYQNGKLTKTWYVGDPTQDQYGTFMLLKDAEKGKSPEPFIMHLPNMYGNLSTRFITSPLPFKCSEVFSYDPLDIASVEVTIPDSSHLNYKVVANSENSFSVFNNAVAVEVFDTSQVRNYLVGFRKVHFENHNYILSEESVDSLKNSTPFYTIKVTSKDGETKGVRIFKRKQQYQKIGLDGEQLEFDQDRVWVALEDGTVVVGQYYVFGKLMRDIRFFSGPQF